MKIAVVSSTLYPANPNFYGSEVENYFLADELAKMGFEVDLYAPPKSLAGDACHRVVPCSYGLASLQYEHEIYREYRDELTDADYIIDATATCAIAENFYFREDDYGGVIVWFRNGVGFSFPRMPVPRRMHGVCLSVPAWRIAVLKYGIPPDILHIIPYGTDTELYSYSPRHENYILYLSRPHWHKGVLKFLAIAREMPDEHFIMAWRTARPDHKYWEERVINTIQKRDLRNVDVVRNLDLEKKIELYQGAKALLIPLSRYYVEAFGLVFVEAMSCGTPVITSRYSGTCTTVVREVTGFRCKTPREYVKAIKNIDAISREYCRRYVENFFAAERMARDYLNLYRRLRARKR